ncbi:MAG: hypothetical protein AB1714_11685 [Acidobacteriota bacterium]
MEVIEIRPNLVADPEGRGLSDFFAAQLVCERATARRVFLAHMTAILGVPVWFCATISQLRTLREPALILFAIVAAALAVSFVTEIRCRLAVSEAEKHVRVNRVG